MRRAGRAVMRTARGPTARDSALNLIGLAAPLVIGVMLIPIIIHGLGVAQFGILSLALSVLEYSALFSFGLGPATTKHVADALTREDGRVAELVTFSMIAHVVLGSIGGILIAASAPLLVKNIFQVPPELTGHALAAFRLLGVMVPATLLLNSLFGALDGARRFGLANLLRVPLSSLSFIIPAVGVTRGMTLTDIFTVLVIVRVLGCVLLVFVVARSVPRFRWTIPSDWTVMRPLLSFGAWLSVSNVVSPALIYADRFVLGAVRGVAAVGMYSAPFDALMRVLIIPASLVRATFPTLSGLQATGDRIRLYSIVQRAERFVFALMLVPIGVLAAFGPELVTWWLGDKIGSATGSAVRILSVGLLFNAIAHVPSSALSAVGRPDVSAKLHVVEIAIHLPLAFWLVSRFGITGAAMAWSGRVIVDSLLLLIASKRILRVKPNVVPADLSDAVSAQASSR